MCLIILLNFLIAVISQGYDNVVAEQEKLHFVNKAYLNYEFFMLEQYFDITKDYTVLVFQIDSEKIAEQEDKFLGFVQTIKNCILKQNQILIKKVIEDQQATRGVIAASQKQL